MKPSTSPGSSRRTPVFSHWLQGVLLLIEAGVIVHMLLRPPKPCNSEYRQYAAQRAFPGAANSKDGTSSIPFLW